MALFMPVDVAKVRRSTGLSQLEFAAKYRLSLGSLKAWEKKARTPRRPTRLYLHLIQREPEAVDRMLKRTPGPT